MRVHLKYGVMLALILLMIALFSCPQLLGYDVHYFFYIYGMHTCPHCTSLKEFLASQYGNDSIYFCDLLDPHTSCADRFINLISIAGLPNSVPLTVVIKDLEVKAIVLGKVINKTFWDDILMTHKSFEVPIYFGTKSYYTILVNNFTDFITLFAPEYFIQKPQTIQPPHITHALTLLTTLALSDAINPCAFYIYTLLLIAASLSSSSKKAVLTSGIAFIAAVFMCYYLLGLGLIIIVKLIPSMILSLIAIFFGIWTVLSGLKGKSRIVAKEGVLNLISRASASAHMSFFFGVMISLTLLPCSSGPYVVFIGIASKYGAPLQYVLLLIYNLIFILPFISILLMITYMMRIRDVQEFIVRHSRGLSIMAGLILIAVGLWLFYI